MRKVMVLAAVVGALAGPGTARAAELDDFRLDTFGDLVDVCADQTDDAAQFCRGWIVGTGQLYIALLKARAVPALACADPIPKLDEIRTAIVRFAAQNPGTRQETSTDGFWRAAASIWPCSK